MNRAELREYVEAEMNWDQSAKVGHKEQQAISEIAGLRLYADEEGYKARQISFELSRLQHEFERLTRRVQRATDAADRLELAWPE